MAEQPLFQSLPRPARIAGTGVLLTGVGIWLGLLASAVTTETRRPVTPERVAAGQPETLADPIGSARDWARQAYVAGLRDCPRVTDAFHAACSAQMAEEAKRAAGSAAARARWAESDLPPAYVPEVPADYSEAADVADSVQMAALPDDADRFSSPPDD